MPFSLRVNAVGHEANQAKNMLDKLLLVSGEGIGGRVASKEGDLSWRSLHMNYKKLHSTKVFSNGMRPLITSMQTVNRWLFSNDLISTAKGHGRARRRKHMVALW